MAYSAQQQRLWLARGEALGQALNRLAHRLGSRRKVFFVLLIMSAPLYADPSRVEFIKESLDNYRQALAVYCRARDCGPTLEGAERELHEHPVMFAYAPPLPVAVTVGSLR